MPGVPLSQGIYQVRNKALHSQSTKVHEKIKACNGIINQCFRKPYFAQTTFLLMVTFSGHWLGTKGLEHIPQTPLGYRRPEHY